MAMGLLAPAVRAQSQGRAGRMPSLHAPRQRGAYVPFAGSLIDSALAGRDSIWEAFQADLQAQVKRFDLDYLTFYGMPRVLADSARTERFTRLGRALKRAQPHLEIGVVLDRSAWAYFPDTTLPAGRLPVADTLPSLPEIGTAMLRMAARSYRLNEITPGGPLIDAFTTEYEYWNDAYLRMVLPRGRSITSYHRETAYTTFLTLLRGLDSLGQCHSAGPIRREVYHRLRRKPPAFAQRFPPERQARQVAAHSERLFYVHYFWNLEYTWERWCQDLALYSQSGARQELWPLFGAYVGSPFRKPYDWEYDYFGQRLPCADSVVGNCAQGAEGRFRHFAEGGQGNDLRGFPDTVGLARLENTYFQKWQRAHASAGDTTGETAGPCDSLFARGGLRLGGYQYFHLWLLRQNIPPPEAEPVLDTTDQFLTRQTRVWLHPTRGRGPLHVQSNKRLYVTLLDLSGQKLRTVRIKPGRKVFFSPGASSTW
jgi:hypothetical protein